MVEDSLFGNDDLDDDPYEPPKQSHDFVQYRSISKAAVVAVVVSVLSLLAVLDFGFWWFLPATGLVVGLFALRVTTRLEQQISGKGFALAGLGFNAAIFLVGSTVYTIEYLTEVPDGYQRISFYTLDAEGVSVSNPISTEILQLDKNNIFIKGYIHPGVNGLGRIQRFVLVGDLKTCCFGGQPKPWDMVEVNLKKDHELVYDMKVHKLWGKMEITTGSHLAVGSTKEVTGDRPMQGGYYALEADGVK
ncbi:MAG: hypothetical protein VX738_04745 [Planctomycetota bacterium]|nr:hypothetical protein [Planctomycetota bacterium]